MATATKSRRVTVRVCDYREGTHLGRAEITRDAHEMYQESAQWPQGIIAAGDVLSGGDRDRLGITSGQTIWLEEMEQWIAAGKPVRIDRHAKAPWVPDMATVWNSLGTDVANSNA